MSFHQQTKASWRRPREENSDTSDRPKMPTNMNSPRESSENSSCNDSNKGMKRPIHDSYVHRDNNWNNKYTSFSQNSTREPRKKSPRTIENQPVNENSRNLSSMSSYRRSPYLASSRDDSNRFNDFKQEPAKITKEDISANRSSYLQRSHNSINPYGDDWFYPTNQKDLGAQNLRNFQSASTSNSRYFRRHDLDKGDIVAAKVRKESTQTVSTDDTLKLKDPGWKPPPPKNPPVVWGDGWAAPNPEAMEKLKRKMKLAIPKCLRAENESAFVTRQAVVIREGVIVSTAANQSQTDNSATSKDELPPKLSNDHDVIGDLVSKVVSVVSDDKDEEITISTDDKEQDLSEKPLESNNIEVIVPSLNRVDVELLPESRNSINSVIVFSYKDGSEDNSTDNFLRFQGPFLESKELTNIS